MMSLLREVPSTAAAIAADRVIRDRRQHAVIDRRLDQLERDAVAFEHALRACDKATEWLPPAKRQHARRRLRKLGLTEQLAPLAAVRPEHDAA
jgi:hypothetical protein